MWMQIKNKLGRKKINKIILNLWVAIAYAIAVTISLEFISLPGKVASVWLPSALTFALVFRLGNQVFPGIILGSMIGLIPNILEWKHLAISIVLLNIICSLANCLQPWIATNLIKKIANRKDIFNHVNTVCIFIFAAVIAPTASATMGITTSCVIGTIPWSKYLISWVTWWLASALAHLIFTPPLILWQDLTLPKKQPPYSETILVFLLFIAIIVLTFIYKYPLSYTLLPILIWTVFRCGNFVATLLIAITSVIAIISTVLGYGFESLIRLQSFMGVFALTTLILSALIDEKRAAQLSLKQTLANLELQVIERTAALQQSEAQLDGFFSSASIGMGILDQQLKYLRVNEILADIHGASISDHIGKTIAEILPQLAGVIEPLLEKVLITGQPLLNQEITGETPSKPGIQQTWLVSYFPIFDINNHPMRVGVVVVEISDRKQLEIQLQKQARIDGLTQIANRGYFDEVLFNEWQRCIRTKEPITIILCDADYFKAYNDTYGHPMGDICLIKIAEILKINAKRASDLVARYGGEEFVILLPNTTLESALHIANLIRDQIHNIKIPHSQSQISDYVTLSMGIATCIPAQKQEQQELINQADKALYKAKQQGRDRIICAEQTTKFIPSEFSEKN
jgi:diguanylate cyclase (GGDEF)-like protein/PAS domain S-box-containing protein